MGNASVMLDGLQTSAALATILMVLEVMSSGKPSLIRLSLGSSMVLYAAEQTFL